jgi:UV DNA damage endonuclease
LMLRSIIKTHRSNPLIAFPVLRPVSLDSQSFRAAPHLLTMPPKRKRSAAAATPTEVETSSIDRSHMRRSAVPLPPSVAKNEIPLPRRQSARGGAPATTNPDVNPEVLDGISALRASPDGHEDDSAPNGVGKVSTADAQAVAATTENKVCSSSATEGIDAAGAPYALVADTTPQKPGRAQRKKAEAPAVKQESGASNIAPVNGVIDNAVAPADSAGMLGDPNAADRLGDEEGEEEFDVKEAFSRPPPINSEYLPLPWKGRLGYVRSVPCILPHVISTDVHAY